MRKVRNPSAMASMNPPGPLATTCRGRCGVVGMTWHENDSAVKAGIFFRVA